MKTWKNLVAIASFLCFASCGGSSKTTTPVDVYENITVPTTFTFKGKFDTSNSSVSYSGQTLRQVLIKDLSAYIRSLTTKIDTAAITPGVGDTLSALNFYYEFDSTTSGLNTFGFSSTPALLQTNFNDISTGKNLKEKFAGNDLVGQYKDWTKDFKGWDDSGVTGVAGSVTNPEELLISFFNKLDQIVADRAAGNPQLDPDGVAITSAQVTSNGLNLQELIDKFLLGAVAYSQGIDDYLDDDLEGKGLNSDNIVQEGTSNYTALEHAWDEAFGYFGSSRDYESYTDTELSASGGNYKDTNGDGAIDLESEYIFSLASYANKRDLASHVDAPTNFTKEAFDAFLKGRALINGTNGALNVEQMKELKKQRTIIANTWEKIIAATMVRYLNGVIVHMNNIGTTAYSFTGHAGQWSEMKGFALCFQFNSKKLMSQADFELIHEKIGVQPVIATDGAEKLAEYKTSLLSVRKILQDTYNFSDKNIGDDNGLNGW
jgi:hypothetical protein